MKKDKIERFIRDNRDVFDDREPPHDLWKRIEAGLDKQSDQVTPGTTSPFQQIHRNQAQTELSAANQTTRTRFRLDWPGLDWPRLDWPRLNWPGSAWTGLDWRVAASVAVLLLAGSFLFMNYQYGVTHQPEVVAASPSYAKEVVQYTRLIDNKRTELKQMTQDNPVLYQEFATDLDRLENSYQSLKDDLPRNPNQDVLIRAMIQNLHYQINLLNEQLRVIQRINTQTHENPV